jgi:hypothetical protein
MKAMNPLDIIYFGWYHILDKTIYGLGFERGPMGPREHSFFVTFLVHGINVSTLLDFLLVKYFNVSTPLYLNLSIAVLIFAIGYLVYFKRRKASEIITKDVSTAKAILFVILSLVYVIVSVYLMIETAHYVRYRLTGLM